MRYKQRLISVIGLAFILSGCTLFGTPEYNDTNAVPPVEPYINANQEVQEKEDSCFTEEQCPLVRYICAEGFESFSDPSNPVCACGCRKIETVNDVSSTCPPEPPVLCAQGLSLACVNGTWECVADDESSTVNREICPPDRPACAPGQDITCTNGKWYCIGAADPN